MWQAGRATCATGLAFKPISIGVSTFHDQGAGNFNPSIQVLDEAVLNEWPGRSIGLFVSVGCGKRSSNQREAFWWEGMAGEFAEAKHRLEAKIDKCEDIHLQMMGDPEAKRFAFEKDRLNERPSHLQIRGVPEENYVRLNVDKGVGDLNMNEWKKLGGITQATENYLQNPKVRTLIDRGAEKMWEIQMLRQGRNPHVQDGYEDSAPAYRPPVPDPNPNAVELPGEDPPSLYPRPLSRPGPQYPAAYPHPFEEVIGPEEKFSIIPSEAPQAVNIIPRISEDSSYRPSSELHGSDAAFNDSLRRSFDSIPPPLPPKTPIQYNDDPRRYTMPHRVDHRTPLPYPDTDGPPPTVNMARKPQFIQR